MGKSLGYYIKVNVGGIIIKSGSDDLIVAVFLYLLLEVVLLQNF